MFVQPLGSYMCGDLLYKASVLLMQLIVWHYLKLCNSAS